MGKTGVDGESGSTVFRCAGRRYNGDNASGKNLMKTAILTICTFFCLTLATSAKPQAMVKPTTDGRGAAMKWLRLVDEGAYGKSWDLAAKSFRSRMTKAEWVAGMKKFRAHYGKVSSRKFKESMYALNPPGFVPGEHETLRFTINLARRGRATEVVSMVMQNKGEWRVSGYSIEPFYPPVQL
jgi:Protein of unknown function (DUF4019)